MTRDEEASSRFVGAWRLESCETRSARGEVQHPFGERPLGQLLYDGTGNMSAHLMRADRSRSATRDPARGTDTEVRDALDAYVAYFGTYSVDDSNSAVTHRVQGASYPSWIGTNLTRYYAFDDDGRLRLSTPPTEVGGESLEYVLLWERMS